MKSWKTTAAGILVAAVAAATALGYITPEQSAAIMGALTAIGLVVAKDSNVTGGSTPQ